MELDELKHIWKQQEIEDEMEYSQSELMVLINNKMLSLEKEIKSRDRLEIIACAMIVLFFGYILFTSSSMWTQIGSATLVLAGIFIAYKLKSAQIKRKDESAQYDHSMQEHLSWELQQLRRQKKLLKNVAWWYIAPIVVGLLFFTMGSEMGLVIQVVYMGGVLAFSGFVWYLNQRTVKKKFEPLIKEIREAIKSLKETDK